MRLRDRITVAGKAGTADISLLPPSYTLQMLLKGESHVDTTVLEPVQKKKYNISQRKLKNESGAVNRGYIALHFLHIPFIHSFTG